MAEAWDDFKPDDTPAAAPTSATPAWEDFGAETQGKSLALNPVQQKEYHALLKDPSTTPQQVSDWSVKNGWGPAVGNVQTVLDHYRKYPNSPTPTYIVHLPDTNQVPNAETGLTQDLPTEAPAKPEQSSLFAATPGWGEVAKYLGDKVGEADWALEPDTRKLLGGDNTYAAEGQPLHALKPLMDAPANAAQLAYDALPAMGVVGSILKDAANKFLPDVPNIGKEDKGSTGVGDIIAEIMSNPMVGAEITGLAGAHASMEKPHFEDFHPNDGILDTRKAEPAPVVKDPNTPRTKEDLANEKFGTQEATAPAPTPIPAPKKGRKGKAKAQEGPFVPTEEQVAHHQAVTDVVNQTAEGWTNAPKINVVHSRAELPTDVERDIAASANPEGVKAVIGGDGQVHILAHKLADPAEATGIVYHEALGHHGLTQKFGTALDKTLEGFYNNSPIFKARVDRWLKDNPGAYGGRADTVARAADEVLAEMSEKGPIQTTLTNKLKNVIKDYARKAGFKNVEYSDREIQQILGEAHNNVIHGSEWGKKGVTRFISRDQWHGTPANEFDGKDSENPHGKFLDTRMGTGEGAQAFAWGHYTAENAGISDKEYRQRLLSSKGELHIDGQKAEDWWEKHGVKQSTRNPEVTDYPPSPGFPEGRPAGRKRAQLLGKPLYIIEHLFTDSKPFLNDFADVVKGNVDADHFYNKAEQFFKDEGLEALWPKMQDTLDKMIDKAEIKPSGRGQLFKVEPNVKRRNLDEHLKKPFDPNDDGYRPAEPIFMNYNAPFHEQHPLVQKVLREHGGEDWNPKTESALNAEHASVSTRLEEIEAQLDHLHEENHPDDSAEISQLEAEHEDLSHELDDIDMQRRDVNQPIGEKAYFMDLGKLDDTGDNYKTLSKALHAKGITGVKFLDGNSRHFRHDAPFARYNHVYFDGNDLKIVDKVNTDEEMAKFIEVADAAGAKVQKQTDATTATVDIIQEAIHDGTDRNLKLPDLKEVMGMVGARVRNNPRYAKYADQPLEKMKEVAQDLLDEYRKGLDEKGSRFASAPRSLTPEKMETVHDLDDLTEFMGKTAAKGARISHTETIAQARDIGLTLPKYLQGGNITDKLAAQLKGAHELLVTTLDNLAALGEKAEKEGLTPALKTTIAQHLAIAQAVYGKFSADAAEVGRALNILKTSSLSKGFGEEAAKFASDGGIAGLVHNDDDLIRFLNGIRAVKANGGSNAVAQYVSRFHKALPEDYAKLVIFNSMLSSPVTAIKNMAGSPMNFTMDMVADTTGAALGKVPGAEGGRSFREIGARMYGALDAFRQWDTYKNIYKAVETGKNTVSKPFYAHRNDIMNTKWAIPIKAPGRLLAGVDEMWANIFHLSNLRGVAVSEALKTGLKGQDLTNKIHELSNKPTPEMIAEADRITNRQLFRGEPSDFVKAVGKAQQPITQDQMIVRMEVDPKTGKATPVGKTTQKADGPVKRAGRFGLSVTVPFMTTTENIVKEIVRNSGPLAGFNKEIRADIMAGGAARHSALGRIALSSAFMGWVVHKANSGEITGAPDPDWNKEKELSSVRPPYSFKVGDKWVSYAGFDPIAGQVAAMATAAQRGGGDVFTKEGLQGMVTGTAQSLVNSSYLDSVKNLLEVANESVDMLKGGKGAIPATANLISGQLGNIANPAFVRWINQTYVDPYQRDGSGDGSLIDRTAGRILAGTPGASKTLPVKYDVYGRPVMNARQTRMVEKDEAVLELSRIGKLTATGSLVAPVKKSDLKKVPDVNAQDVQAYQYLKGSYVRESVRGEMKDGSWAKMSDSERAAEVKSIETDMGKAARQKLFPQFYGDE